MQTVPMKKLLFNPWVACVACMVLFAVMYNGADDGFLRVCSYVPLGVALAIFGRGVYFAFKKS